jgi:hypothetical protein
MSAPSCAVSFTMRVCATLPRLAIDASASARFAFQWTSFEYV